MKDLRSIGRELCIFPLAAGHVCLDSPLTRSAYLLWTMPFLHENENRQASKSADLRQKD